MAAVCSDNASESNLGVTIDMANVVQAARYLGSIISEPAVRLSLRLSSRFQRFSVIRVNAWVFRGPSTFIKLVDAASRRLEREDAELLSDLGEQFTVLYSPRKLFAFPTWRYGGISDDFVQWGSEGVLAAWIFLYFRSRPSRKARWFMSAAPWSLAATQHADEQTAAWLRSHRFPPELCRVFDGQRII